MSVKTLDNLCPDVNCETHGLIPLITEPDKVLCPVDEAPVVIPCTMVIIKVTSNVNDLQYDKMYKKVCEARHKIEPLEIYHGKPKIDTTFDHLCPPCT